MFKNIRTVLFDLDGTLIDSAPDLGAAANKMRTHRGLPALPLADYRPVAGAGARGLLAQAFGMPPEHPEFSVFREEFFSNYEAQLTQNTFIFEGVTELINTLIERQWAWGVVTNKMARFTNPLTSAMPLFTTAGTIISGDTTPYPKPHPAPLWEAAARLGVAPQECVYVGDDERDIAAGLAAGMKTVAATYGYLGTTTDFSQWGAHIAINSPMELLKWLDGV